MLRENKRQQITQNEISIFGFTIISHTNDKNWLVIDHDNVIYLPLTCSRNKETSSVLLHFIKFSLYQLLTPKSVYDSIHFYITGLLVFRHQFNHVRDANYCSLRV